MKPHTKAVFLPVSLIVFTGAFGICQAAGTAENLESFIGWAVGWLLVSVGTATLAWMKVDQYVRDLEEEAEAATLRWERGARKMMEPKK